MNTAHTGLNESSELTVCSPVVQTPQRRCNSDRLLLQALTLQRGLMGKNDICKQLTVHFKVAAGVMNYQDHVRLHCAAQPKVSSELKAPDSCPVLLCSSSSSHIQRRFFLFGEIITWEGHTSVGQAPPPRSCSTRAPHLQLQTVLTVCSVVYDSSSPNCSSNIQEMLLQGERLKEVVDKYLKHANLLLLIGSP